MSFLNIDSIHKTYSEAPVLSDINIGIEKGEFWYWSALRAAANLPC